MKSAPKNVAANSVKIFFLLHMRLLQVPGAWDRQNIPTRAVCAALICR
jgi:hypothetical protein